MSLELTPQMDAEMSWLADDADLNELPVRLVRQAGKSLTGRGSVALYRRYFEIIRADTPELRDLVYRLRFQVYAHERGFENPDNYSDGREQDEYDERSMHILLRHRRSGIVLGAARIVLPKGDDPANSFPVQTVSSHPMLHDADVAAHAVEFSRLAISRERLKRCHIGSGKKGGKISHLLAKQLFPFLSVGLIAGVIELASENGYPILLAVMEPFLIRNLRKIGIEFPFMDAPVEYHGLRVPCALLSLHEACVAMKQKDRAAWEIATNKGRTQEMALIAQTRSERARRAVARAFRLAKQPAPILLQAPSACKGARGPQSQVDPIVSQTA